MEVFYKSREISGEMNYPKSHQKTIKNLNIIVVDPLETSKIEMKIFGNFA